MRRIRIGVHRAAGSFEVLFSIVPALSILEQDTAMLAAAAGAASSRSIACLVRNTAADFQRFVCALTLTTRESDLLPVATWLWVVRYKVQLR